MLGSARVLICEDEFLIGIDLAISVEAAGGVAVGPAASVRQAMALIDAGEIDAAILDVNLLDGSVTPVAMRLLERSIPVVMQTGTGLPRELESRNGLVGLFMKPVESSRLIADLAVRLKAH